MALTVVALTVAIPQSRAVIAHVLRLGGVELRQSPGPSPAPHPSLPGEQRMPLEQARQRVAFPVLVPAKLGRPDAVTVSDNGRVATLIYDRTPYGQVRYGWTNSTATWTRSISRSSSTWATSPRSG